MKSIIQCKNECFICKINYDVLTTNNFNKYQEKLKNALELSLKQLAQKKFEETQNRKDFIKHFNKNYL